MFIICAAHVGCDQLFLLQSSLRAKADKIRKEIILLYSSFAKTCVKNGASFVCPLDGNIDLGHVEVIHLHYGRMYSLSLRPEKLNLHKK